MTIGTQRSNTGYPRYASTAELKTIDLQSGDNVEIVAKTAGWIGAGNRPSGRSVYNIVTLAEFSIITSLLVADEVNDFLLTNGNIAMLDSALNAMYPLKTGEVGVLNYEYEYDDVFRFIPVALHADIVAGTITTDLSVYIINAITSSTSLVFGDGTFTVFTTIAINKPIIITGSGVGNCTIKFTPSVAGDYLFEFSGQDHFSFEHILFLGPGRATLTNEVCMDLFNPAANSEYQWSVTNCKFEDWNKAGIYLGGQWQGTIRNNYFQKCGDTTDIAGGSVLPFTGGIVFEENGGAANWSGSGNDIANNYIVSCSYGIYNDEGWCVTLINNIFEFCGYPYYKSAAGTQMLDINSWMEDFGLPALYKAPDIRGEVVQIGGRSTTGGDNPKLRTYSNASTSKEFVAYAGTQDCKSRIETTRFDVSTPASTLRFATTDTAGTLSNRWQITQDGDLDPVVNNVSDIGGPTTAKPRNIYLAGFIAVADSIAAPAATSGAAKLFVDSADNSLKVRFGNGTIKTIATNP